MTQDNRPKQWVLRSYGRQSYCEDVQNEAVLSGIFYGHYWKGKSTELYLLLSFVDYTLPFLLYRFLIN